MKKNGQFVLVLSALLITLACAAFMESEAVIAAMAGSFLGTVGAYTALDLRAAIKGTGKLPPGSYQEAGKGKYLTGAVSLAGVFALLIVRSRLTGMNFDLAYGFLGPGIITILTIIISGMKVNKAATMDGPVKP